jgi:cytochrome P450
MPKTYPPGPNDWCLGLLIMAKMRKDILGFYQEMLRKYGDVVYMRLGPFRDYTFFHPEQIKEILVTKAKQFVKLHTQRAVLAQWDGNGLLLSEGDFWLRQRRLMQPAFHPKRFGRYGEIMVDCTQRLLKTWEERCQREGFLEIDFNEAMTDLTLDIVSRTLFGADIPASQVHAIGQAVASLNEIAMTELVSGLVTMGEWSGWYDWRKWLPKAHRQRKAEATGLLDQVIRGFIAERRKTGEDKGDLLSILLSSVDEEADGKGMTDEQARDEALVLFLAGHDTTASGLTWISYALAQYPEWTAKVRQELAQVLGDRLPTAADAPKLGQLDRFIKETLRRWPPAVGVFARENVADVEIGGWPLKKGAIVHMISYVVHHDPRWFPEPTKFDPARFLPERLATLPQFAYFPFGGGPRSCIGNTFATLEMMLVAATLLQRFDLTLAPGQGEPELLTQLSLRPKGGLKLRLTPRRTTDNKEEPQ